MKLEIKNNKKKGSFFDKYVELLGFYPLLTWMITTIMFVGFIVMIIISVVPFWWIKFILFVLFGAYYGIIAYGMYQTFKKKKMK